MYNLAELEVHVTAAVYKNLSILMPRMNEHPVFCGPLLHHTNSDVDTFFGAVLSPFERQVDDLWF